MACPDFEEFIVALNERGVRYLVVGAHAVAFHARPRATKDLDIYVAPSKANARRLLAAVADFFGTRLTYEVEDVLDPHIIIQLGVAPVRIDLLSHLPGIESFARAFNRSLSGKFGTVDTQYLSLPDLIAAKATASRPQDRADLAVLRKAQASSTRRSK